VLKNGQQNAKTEPQAKKNKADTSTLFKFRNIYVGGSVLRYDTLMNACTQLASEELGTPFGTMRNEMCARLHVNVLTSHFLTSSERLDLMKSLRAH
jgi:hypothetical protein